MKTHTAQTGALLCSAVLFTLIQPIHADEAGVVQVKWTGGASLPRHDQQFSSDSFPSAQDHLVTTIKNGLTTFDGTGQVIKISNNQQGATVQQLMDAKKSSGALTFSGRQYEGLGTFVESINGSNNDAANKIFWQFYVNGKKSPTGASSYLLNIGDEVRWVLDSIFNDDIVLEKNLGDYTGTLATVDNPSWHGALLPAGTLPLEKGQSWFESVWIFTNSGVTFIPKDITNICHIESWSPSTQSWKVTSTIQSKPADPFVIGQSLSAGSDNISGNADDQLSGASLDRPTSSFILLGKGLSFFPFGQNGPESVKLANALALLRTGKTRLRHALKVPFTYGNGVSGIFDSTKTTMKAEISFNDPQSPILKMSGKFLQFSPDSETDLYLIERSPDLGSKANWSDLFWGTGSKSRTLPTEGERNFFRLRRF